MAEKSDPLLVCGPACAEPASTDAISAQNDEVMAIKSIYEDCFEELGVRESSDTRCKHMEYSIRIDIEPLVTPCKVIVAASEGCGDAPPVGSACSVGPGCDGSLKPVLIRYLRPFLLKFRLPTGYPSSCPPMATVVSPMLTPQSHAALIEKLATIWEDYGRDCSVDDLVAFDSEKAAEVFASELHTCDVCLGDKLGKDFVKLQSGEVLDLKCVDVDCGSVIPPHIIKDVLLTYHRPDLWDSFERFTLLKGLEQLGDMVYCPRKACGKPVLLDRVDVDGASAATATQWTTRGMIGMCGYCGYVFCRECRKVWHGGSKCETIVQKWLDGTPEVREELEKRFGSLLFHQALSEEWITKHTKPCPQCRTAIEKNLGCNHMTCKKCSYQWCWLCNATYTPGHYQRTACEQFGDEYFQELGITREMYYERFF